MPLKNLSRWIFFFFTILLQLDQETHGRFHVLHRSCRLMLGVGQKSMDCLANTGLLLIQLAPWGQGA